MSGGIMKCLLILLFAAVLFSCSSNNGTNPNPEYREIPSYKLFFESSHYNNEFYATGDTIQVVLVDTLGVELPDSVEVILQSDLGDSESIILKNSGQYIRRYDKCGSQAMFFEDSLTGFIISSGSEKSIKRNGVLEVNPQKDSISTYCKGFPEINEIIPIENIKKEILKVGLFEFWDGTWYLADERGGWAEVLTKYFFVIFKPSTTEADILALNTKYGVTIKSKLHENLYTLQAPEGVDLVYLCKEYEKSDIVECAEPDMDICVEPC